jgi:hypothetical protein
MGLAGSPGQLQKPCLVSHMLFTASRTGACTASVRQVAVHIKMHAGVIAASTGKHSDLRLVGRGSVTIILFLVSYL